MHLALALLQELNAFVTSVAHQQTIVVTLMFIISSFVLAEEKNIFRWSFKYYSSSVLRFTYHKILMRISFSLGPGCFSSTVRCFYKENRELCALLSDTFMCFTAAETIIDVSIVEYKKEQVIWAHYNKVKIIFMHPSMTMTPSQRMLSVPQHVVSLR